MTLVRKLALKISDAVVRYASPGGKEWAEGLAREVTFVEDDWAALAWALGSVRVLLDYREVPLGSLADVSAAAERFAQLVSGNHPIWLQSVLYFSLPLEFFEFFPATNWSERVGGSLVVLGFAALGILMLIEWRRRIKVPPSNDVDAVIQFYKTELKWDLHGGRKSWIAVFAVSFLCVGMILAEPAAWAPYACGPLWVGFMLRFLQMRRIDRRRLGRLDVLLAERP